MKKIFICCMLFMGITTFSQTDLGGGPVNLSPNGLMDTLYDQFGNSFKLSDLVISKDTRDDNGQILRRVNATPYPCGYFNLYFDNGCGFEGSNTLNVQRRNVLCQVLTDLSAFIVSPPLTASNKKVNIWVRNPAAISMPADALGSATSFYSYPNGVVNGGGVIDGEVWKTIHTGQDSYNYLFPLYTNNTNANNGLFFHGWMSFNVQSTSISWNLDTTIPCPALKFDLYTVLLHEITHALGFASLLAPNGQSLIGANTFSRYDTFLKNNAITDFIIARPTQCNMYNLAFNPALNVSVLQPNPTSVACATNNTVCNTALKFFGAGGTPNVPIYTPNCYEAGSSYSHLEDQCVSPFTNNAFFAMAERIPLQSTKRHLQLDEKNVLCSIGYSLNSSYTSPVNLGTFSYGSSCGGINVAGLNDGIITTGSNAGTFNYVVNAGTSINITGILANDINANTFECLEDLTANSSYPTTLTPLSGNSSTPISFTSNLFGMHLLRYIPVNASGQKGNVTYVYVFVKQVCPAVSCDLVKNGRFENSSGCGQYQSAGYPGPSIDCWSNLSLTPDLYNRSCANPYGFNAIIPTNFSIPSTDTWNAVGNNKFLGLGGSDTLKEAMQTTLSSPVLANTRYILIFKAKVLNNFNYGAGILPNIATPVIFAGSQNMLAPTTVSTTLPSAAFTLASVTIPNNNQWNYFTVILNNTTTALNYLTVMNGQTATGITYVVVDDVSIIQQNNGPFQLPANLCADSQSLPNLNAYLNGLPTGGVFAGPGVSGNTLNTSFNMTPGVATISYTYTNSSGCSVTVYSNVNVSEPIAPVISGSTSAYPTAPNNATTNTTTIPSGYTASWTITGGTGTFTTGTNGATVGVTWSVLPGELTLTLTNTIAGCTYTTTQYILNSFACNCLTTQTFSYTKVNRTVTLTVSNTNPNCASNNEAKFNYGDGVYPFGGTGATTHTYAANGTYTITMNPCIVNYSDGCFCSAPSTSTSVTVTCKSGCINPKQANSSSAITIYPNPASESLNFDVSFKNNSPLKVIIRTIDGRELLSKEWNLNKGKHDLQLELPNNLSDGMIFVQLISDEIRETRTIMIKK